MILGNYNKIPSYNNGNNVKPSYPNNTPNTNGGGESAPPSVPPNNNNVPNMSGSGWSRINWPTWDLSNRTTREKLWGNRPNYELYQKNNTWYYGIPGQTPILWGGIPGQPETWKGRNPERIYGGVIPNI